MGFIELFLIALGLSMDAFAVAVCAGLNMQKPRLKKSLIIGLYFGVFQAVMPLIGYLAATLFAELISAYDHWIASALLFFIGGRMLFSGFKNEGCPDRVCPEGMCEDRVCPEGKKPEKTEMSLGPAQMLPLAVATSIDALAVGISFAFLNVLILPAVWLIGATTFTLSLAGVKTGNLFGDRFKSKAELAGGVILVLMGLKILFEHIGILSFIQ